MLRNNRQQNKYLAFNVYKSGETISLPSLWKQIECILHIYYYCITAYLVSSRFLLLHGLENLVVKFCDYVEKENKIWILDNISNKLHEANLKNIMHTVSFGFVKVSLHKTIAQKIFR